MELFAPAANSHKFRCPLAHARGIVHRDLKPENILFASKSMAADVLVTDFGLAKMLDPATFLMTACGTPQYVGASS